MNLNKFTAREKAGRFIKISLCTAGTCFFAAFCSAQEDASWLLKAKKEMVESRGVSSDINNTALAAPAQVHASYQEKFLAKEAATYEGTDSTLKLAKPYKKIEETAKDASAQPTVIQPGATAPAAAKKPATVQKQPAQAAPQQPAAPQKPKQKYEYIKWNKKASGHFTVYSEPRTSGVPTPNLNMKFETIYQALNRNISWIIGKTKADVYVYQGRQSFLDNEPAASSWTGAFFDPDNNRIVMYDDPAEIDRIIEQFSHEVTHLFVENYFNPPDKGFKMEPPIWMNEGLAVNMEDIATNTKGGAWASDLVVVNLLGAAGKRELEERAAQSGALRISRKEARELVKQRNILSNKTIAFRDFGEFIRSDSYDKAVAQGDVDNWYFQAYAMIRFLFKPNNGTYPEKSMQFKQFLGLLNSYNEKKDAAGQSVKTSDGKKVMVRTSAEDALRKAYGYRSVIDFEDKFWQWLRGYQQTERERLLRDMQRR